HAGRDVRDVLDRGADAAGGPDLVATPGEVGRHPRRVDRPLDQARHATPAWRPAVSPSRRKLKYSGWQMVQQATSSIASTPAALRRRAASVGRSTVRPVLANAARTSSPTS